MAEDNGALTFDVDEILYALGQAKVKLKGTEYPITLPSFLDRAKHDKRFADVDLTSDEGLAEYVGAVCELVGLPTDVVMELPDAALDKLVVFVLATMRGADARKVAAARSNEQSENSESSADHSQPESS